MLHLLTLNLGKILLPTLFLKTAFYGIDTEPEQEPEPELKLEP
jgi:hypothetical protein